MASTKSASRNTATKLCGRHLLKYFSTSRWLPSSKEKQSTHPQLTSQFFCLHGGLSPKAQLIESIRSIDRKQQIPHEGIMCDLLWSDPSESGVGFGQSPRQAGYTWGSDKTDKFLHMNSLRMICRAHQLVMEGYKQVHQKKCVTVFSAPNYCYRCNNMASILEIDDALTPNYQQYEPAPRQTEPHTVKRVPSYFL